MEKAKSGSLIYYLKIHESADNWEYKYKSFKEAILSRFNDVEDIGDYFHSVYEVMKGANKGLYVGLIGDDWVVDFINKEHIQFFGDDEFSHYTDSYGLTRCLLCPHN